MPEVHYWKISKKKDLNAVTNLINITRYETKTTYAAKRYTRPNEHHLLQAQQSIKHTKDFN